MKPSILLTILAAALVIPSAQAQQKATSAQTEIGGLLISPLMQRLTVKPGQSTDVAFVADNPRQSRESAQFELVSFTLEEGNYRTIFGAENPRDCSVWFPSKVQEVQVEPGQRKDIHLKFDVPRGSSGAYWCMLRVTPHPDGSTTKSMVTYEIPLVLIAGKNLKPTLKVSTPTIGRVPGAKNGFLATLPIESTGEGFTTIGAIGTLRSMPSGRVINDFRLDDRNLMPLTKRNISFLVPALPDGQYRVQFRPIVGTRTLESVTADYSVAKGEAKLVTEAASLEQSPVSIEPSSLNVSIPKGGNRSFNIKITNNGAKPIPVALSASGLDQNLVGAIGISETKAPLGMTVEIDNDPDPIEPGETRTVHVSLGVPETAEGDIWFALVAKETGNSKALVESSLCSISIPLTQKPGMVIENPQVIKDGARSIAVKFQVRNSGNTALRPDPSAAVLESGVKLLERVGVDIVGDGGILPGRTIENTIMIPQKLKPGNHVLEIDYQYGPTSFAKLRVPITIPGPGAAKPAGKSVKK